MTVFCIQVVYNPDGAEIGVVLLFSANFFLIPIEWVEVDSYHLQQA